MRTNQYKNGKLQARNRFFIRFVMLLVMIGVSGTFGMILHANAMNESELPISESNETAAVETETDIRSIVCVEPGDTLWKIAKAYGPEDVSVKKYVQQIMAANDLDSAGLQVGQVLRLP